MSYFPTDRTIHPARLARELEARGFESLFVSEHTHIPVDHTPYPGGGDLPDEYYRTGDPFVTLAMAAAVTERLRLGTGICLVAQHDPIDLAKQVATLDHFSGGRVEFGIGYGWNREELEHHGVVFADRRAVVRERILLAKRLWTDEIASFDGEHEYLAPSHMWPKPVQAGGPPILLGSVPGPATTAHLVEFCDGWFPIGGRGLRQAIPEIHEALEAAGRDPADFAIQLYGATPDVEKLRHFAEVGVTRALFYLPYLPESQQWEYLDACTAAKEEFGS